MGESCLCGSLVVVRVLDVNAGDVELLSIAPCWIAGFFGSAKRPLGRQEK